MNDAILATHVCTPDEARKVLRIGKNAIYSAIKSGEIPSLRIGDSLRVPTSFLRKQLGIEAA